MKFLRESLDDVRPELIDILVSAGKHGCITAAKMQRARSGYCYLRQAVRIGF